MKFSMPNVTHMDAHKIMIQFWHKELHEKVEQDLVQVRTERVERDLV